MFGRGTTIMDDITAYAPNPRVVVRAYFTFAATTVSTAPLPAQKASLIEAFSRS